MEPTVYVETSIISYLTARPSRDVVAAARQQTTIEWWSRRRQLFRVHASELVIDEAREGDSVAVERRLAALHGTPILAVSADAAKLAASLMEDGAVPRRAAADALQIAIAAVNGMGYLLTWNCRHIANARTRPRVEQLLRVRGFDPPTLCTPDELMED